MHCSPFLPQAGALAKIRPTHCNLISTEPSKRREERALTAEGIVTVVDPPCAAIELGCGRVYDAASAQRGLYPHLVSAMAGWMATGQLFFRVN